MFEHFDGKADNYRNWASRVKDHLLSTNLNWGSVLEVIEKERVPLTKARLQTIAGIDDAPMDMVKVSQLLWAFLGNHCLKNSIYERRLQLTSGEDNNGFELWRALFQENEGGAEQVIMGACVAFFVSRSALIRVSSKASLANGNICVRSTEHLFQKFICTGCSWIYCLMTSRQR